MIHFSSQVNLPGVDQQTGLVNKDAIGGDLRDWEKHAVDESPRAQARVTIEAALTSIRQSVHYPLRTMGWRGEILTVTALQLHGSEQEAASAS